MRFRFTYSRFPKEAASPLNQLRLAPWRKRKKITDKNDRPSERIPARIFSKRRRLLMNSCWLLMNSRRLLMNIKLKTTTLLTFYHKAIFLSISAFPKTKKDADTTLIRVHRVEAAAKEKL